MIKTYKLNSVNYLDLIICMGFILILHIVSLFLWNTSDRLLENYIYIYNWIGIAIISFVLLSWRRLTGSLFTPYTIFFVFMAVFNYGQFIMWALGIHYKGELGTTDFIRYMDNLTLFRIQMIVCIDFLAFHFGSLLVGNKQIKKVKKSSYNKEAFCFALRYVCLVTAFISTPIVLYNSIQNFKVASQFGYTAIYYGSYTQLNPIFKYISYMFFPSLIGIWIGFKCSKKSFYIICMIYLPYLLTNLFAGDRGNWIYDIFILCWCYLNFIRKPKIFNIIKLVTVGSLLLMATSVFVKFREIGISGISTDEIMYVIKDASFIFIKPFFEMGQSARVLGIIIQDNLYKQWNYGNTYIAAILGIILPRIKTWFGYYDFYLDNWISQTYLGLSNYGVGFSITAEAYLNGGLLFSPVIMFIIGMFFSRLFYIHHEDYNNPKRLFVVLSSLSSLIYIARGSFELHLRIWFFGTVVLLIMIEFFKSFFIKKCHVT